MHGPCSFIYIVLLSTNKFQIMQLIYISPHTHPITIAHCHIRFQQTNKLDTYSLRIFFFVTGFHNINAKEKNKCLQKPKGNSVRAPAH